jgi:hypothetical protein
MSEDVLGHVVHLIFVVLSKFYKFTMSEDVLGHVVDLIFVRHCKFIKLT